MIESRNRFTEDIWWAGPWETGENVEGTRSVPLVMSSAVTQRVTQSDAAISRTIAGLKMAMMVQRKALTRVAQGFGTLCLERRS